MTRLNDGDRLRALTLADDLRTGASGDVVGEVGDVVAAIVQHRGDEAAADWVALLVSELRAAMGLSQRIAQ